jgi:hypothetical protein
MTMAVGTNPEALAAQATARDLVDQSTMDEDIDELLDEEDDRANKEQRREEER